MQEILTSGQCGQSVAPDGRPLAPDGLFLMDGIEGLRSHKDGEDLWYDFFNLQKKSVSPQKRIVHYSKEFACPSEVELGLKLLVQKFENGDDVSLHLSKDATSPSAVLFHLVVSILLLFGANYYV